MDCNNDQVEGLTWDEVQQCEVKMMRKSMMTVNFLQERYLVLLNEVGIEGPTRVEFKLADLDGDGILLLNEWRSWVALQK